MTNVSGTLFETVSIESRCLQRKVVVDFFLPAHVADLSQISLLLINDGQNMQELGLQSILDKGYASGTISPLLCAAIHAGAERKMEYGIAAEADFKGRGAKAGLYTSFILEELMPYISKHYPIRGFRQKAFAGFSLGGLSALDIVWNHPEAFSSAGVFSGSLWWRSIDQTDPAYDDDKHRIMHQQIRNSGYKPGLKFFFQCGNMDETRDRNKNGIIDSIDDTRDLVRELSDKGYQPSKDIYYLEMEDGHHDILTWGRAMPVFLEWLG